MILTDFQIINKKLVYNTFLKTMNGLKSYLAV